MGKGVDPDVVWGIAVHSVPQLRDAISELVQVAQESDDLQANTPVDPG